MLRHSLALSTPIYGWFRYTPTNLLIAAIRNNRRGLKWGVPAMLPAVPHLYAAAIGTTIISHGGPGRLDLLVILCIWNAFKMLWLGPITLVLLLRSRAREARERRDDRFAQVTSVDDAAGGVDYGCAAAVGLNAMKTTAYVPGAQANLARHGEQVRNRPSVSSLIVGRGLDLHLSTLPGRSMSQDDAVATIQTDDEIRGILVRLDGKAIATLQVLGINSLKSLSPRTDAVTGDLIESTSLAGRLISITTSRHRMMFDLQRTGRVVWLSEAEPYAVTAGSSRPTVRLLLTSGHGLDLTEPAKTKRITANLATRAGGE